MALSPKPGDLAPVVPPYDPRGKGGHMTKLNRGGLPLALAVLALCAPAAAAAPVSVNVRVEGASKTIFDGQVTTDGLSLIHI